jgi:hypothetical protein
MLRQVVCSIALSLFTAGNVALAHTAHEHPPQMPNPTLQEKRSKERPNLLQSHDHKTLAIPDGQPIPTIKLIITPDAMAGWNMQIVTENFTFAPEHVNGESNTTEGHAHFFLNDRKVARIYGNWSHIPKLPQGKNELRVSLNSNKHEGFTYQGKAIEAIATIEVP